MEFIDGIELLYSEYHSQIPLRIFTWVFAAIIAIITIVCIVIAIKEKQWPIFGLIALWIIFCGCWIGIGWVNSFPYTSYYITVDDTVPYTYMEETFDNIHHEGENVYRIDIDELGDK